ncbi:unnamed protein product [Jaminaea pallidilutea]
MDEVRAMYKERAEIEADYAKRLAKLSKVAVGKDETGATRQAFDVVRAELETTSRVHSDLSVMIRKDLEGTLTDFQGKSLAARKQSSASIDKLFKNKQSQESYVAKSRERYEQDCIKINGYTAQTSLVQGKDLDKVTSKLDKAQSTVATNEKDYQNFVRALKDTTHRWTSDFKTYLDQCQDLEEERLEFIKSNLWNYANAISAVCVADDEGCERVRVALENCDTQSDIMAFIEQRGTGSAIPDAPEYINYSKGQPPPSRPSFRNASFQRSTSRVIQPPPPVQPFVPGEGGVNGRSPGGGAGGGPSGGSSGGGEGLAGEVRQSVVPNAIPPSVVPAEVPTSGSITGDGFGGGPSMLSNISPQRSEQNQPPTVPQPQFGQESSHAPNQPQQPPNANAERRMSAKNFVARTPSSAKRGSGGGSEPPPSAAPAAPVAAPAAESAVEDDPIAKALANLRLRPGGKSPVPGGAPARGHQPQDSREYRPSSRQQQHSGPPRAHSPSISGDRPSSPSAAFMQGPPRASSPMPGDDVVGQYGQSFPGERRALSRQNSFNSARSGASPSKAAVAAGSAPPNRSRSPAPVDGFAGVGARGRSPSPAPQSHAQSSAHVPQQARMSAQHHGRAANGKPQRASTPLGISLDASGSVVHDQMAQEYLQRASSRSSQAPAPQQQQQYQQQQQPAYAHHSQQAQPAYQQRPPSIVHGQQMGSQVGAPSSQYSTAPGPYSGQPPQSAQQHPGYHGGPAGAAQQPMYGHQDSVSSLGRAPGYDYGHAQQQSQTPAMHQQGHQPSASQPYAAGGQPGYGGAPPPQQQHGYGHHQQPSGHQYQQSGTETPAAAYMHQYQRQSQPGAGASASGHQQLHDQASNAGHYPNGGNAPAQQPQRSSYQAASSGGPASAAPGSSAPTPSAAGSSSSSTQTAAAAPTGQYSEYGRPILFYVKALYDYTAQSSEEFSFQRDDVIGVVSTAADGWWTGELLDENRRRKGEEIFPSNFTTLLQ